MGKLYDDLGIKTLINAAGTYTVVGGSKMSEKTLDDMKSASSNFVMIRELQDRIHQKIAKMTRNEAAYVSNGAAACLYLAVAAAIQIKHGKGRICFQEKEAVGEYNIVMFKSHRNPYDLVIGHLGAKYREIGFPNIISPVTEAEFKESIDENTAAIYYAEAAWTAPGTLTIEEVLHIAGKSGIPVIVDAAAQLPPVENLWRFSDMGAAVTLFSGGKDLRGPQASGFMVGRQSFIDVVSSLGFPNYGIGRMLKVGREELVGLYSAIKQYVEMDHLKRLEWCEEQVAELIQAFECSQLFTASRSFPNEAGQPIPRVYLDLGGSGIRAEVIAERLLCGQESIYVGVNGSEGIYINPMTMYDGETKVVINALKNLEHGGVQKHEENIA